MVICNSCEGKGFIENQTPMSAPCKCWRCQGAGDIVLKDIRCGDHCIQFYKDSQEQIETIVAFVAEGLKRREYCICLIEREKIETVRQALQNAGIDHEKDEIKASLSIVSSEDFYFCDQVFEPEKIYKSMVALVNDTAKSYPRGFRVVGELPAIVRECVPETEVLFYESLVHDYFETNHPRFLALCQYHARSISNEVIPSLSQSHALVFSARI